MRREGYYGLLLALLAFVVLYLLNKAGLLHGLNASSSTGTTTTVVSASVGGVPVGSATTTYPKSELVIGGEFDAVMPVSVARQWGSNLF